MIAGARRTSSILRVRSLTVRDEDRHQALRRVHLDGFGRLAPGAIEEVIEFRPVSSWHTACNPPGLYVRLRVPRARRRCPLFGSIKVARLQASATLVAV